MLLATMENPGKYNEIEEVLGLVSADAWEGVSITSEIFARIKNVLGGKVKTIENRFSKATNRAWNSLIDQAKEAGANAVLGLDVETMIVPLRGGFMVGCSITGTAVNIREKS